MCLRVLKESNKRSFDSYSVRNSVLIISHITFRGCGEFFSDNLSQNSCIPNMVSPCWLRRISSGIGGNQKRQNILNEQYTELTYTFKYVMNL